MPNLVSGHHEGFTTNTGDIVERDYSYTYIDARVNVAGHGFLGFDRRTVDEQAEVASVDPGRTTTIDYVPIARYDLNGNPTQSSTPPYLYPLAGLVQATTVDQHVGANSVSPIQKGLFERRTQTINTWAVKLSAFNRPFPYVSARSTTTYDRPVAVIGPPPESGDNGSTLFTCLGGSIVNGYGNVTADFQGCQSVSPGISVEDTVTQRHYSEDPMAWLISNPDNVKLSSTHTTPSGKCQRA
jgi:hypothetical protein